MTRRAAPWLAGAGMAVLAAALLQWLTPGPPPLAYDPEAWLVWGRELAGGTLDVTVGPAIKPLPMLMNAVATSLLGPELARSLWAVVALAGLLGALALTWSLLRAATGEVAVAVAGVALVLVTPTVVDGALTGAAEPLALAGLLGAVRLVSAGRLLAASLMLAAVALLRPEAVPILAALVVAVAARRVGAADRWAAVTVGAASIAVVGVIWVALQRFGGADLAGGVQAATALRPGQPGLARWPAGAALVQAVVMLLPALVLGAIGLLVRGPARPAESAQAGLASSSLLTAAGGLWILTVVVMSQVGFSGEGRYLAPGTVALSLGLLAAAATLRAHRRGAVLLRVAGAALLVAAAATLSAEWADARRVASRQAALDTLLAQPAVRASAATCARVAVPQFMRPPTAWRLNIGLAQIQSPSMAGADCRLLLTPPPAAGWMDVERAGPWAWRQRATP